MTNANRPAGASAPTDASGAPVTDPTAALTGVVEVLADQSGRVGLLSYTVPATMVVRSGDAVSIPFGTQTKHGVVVGPSAQPEKATKDIIEVFGKRSDPRDIALARNIAKFHFADLPTVLGRLAPKSGRGAEPINDTILELHDIPRPSLHGVAGEDRRLVVRAPLVPAEELAAHEAARMTKAHPGAQVLILCPTTRSVAAVMATMASGAQRLDARARAGAWKGFALGTVRVGVGTRAAALYSATNLAGIIVVEEDHPGHLEANQPHTHARDIANARARSLNIPLTLISASPTPAALGAGVAVGSAGSRADWPAMRLIDRGDVDPIQRWAPPALQVAISAENKAGRTPWIVAQRRTAARRCVRCGTLRPCPMCDTSLCRHKDADPCTKCATTEPARMVGWDATRIADLLNGPPAPTRPGEEPKIKRKDRVKVVTVADLHKGKSVGLVVLFDIDAALSIPEYIPEAMAASLLTTAAGAAGKGGAVIALTDNPSAATLVDLFGPRDQMAVARRALAAAKAANLPPFGRLVTVRCGQSAQPRVTNWPGQVLGPMRAGTDWEILVRIPAPRILDLAAPLARIRRGGKVRLTVT